MLKIVKEIKIYLEIRTKHDRDKIGRNCVNLVANWKERHNDNEYISSNLDENSTNWRHSVHNVNMKLQLNQ